MSTCKFFAGSRIAAVALVFLPFALNGCVSLSDYDRDMARMQKQLNDEKTSHQVDVKSLELKLKDRARTLDELTARLSSLQEEKLSEGKLRYGRDDLDAILKKIKELKVEVRENVSGPKAEEMTEEFRDMERRINFLLGNLPSSN